MQRAAGNTAPSTTANLDDYNPFDKTKASTNNSTIASGDSTAAVMDTAPPQYTTSGQQQVSAADFQVRIGARQEGSLYSHPLDVSDVTAFRWKRKS